MFSVSFKKSKLLNTSEELRGIVFFFPVINTFLLSSEMHVAPYLFMGCHMGFLCLKVTVGIIYSSA